MFSTPIPGVTVSHYVPGRLRLHVTKIKSAPPTASEFERRLGAVHGVLHVEANTRTGSLLVEFDPAHFAQPEAYETLLPVLQALFPEVDPELVTRLVDEAFR